MRHITRHSSGILLPAALVVSACLHAALLTLRPDPALSSVARAGHSGISLQLVSLQETAADNTPDSNAIGKEQNKSTTSRNAHAYSEEPGYANTPRPTNTAAAAPAAYVSVTAAHDSPQLQAPSGIPAIAEPVDLSSNLHTQVRHAMQPYFSYPMLARRRGWQGTVRIGMRISADGHISRLHIVETSRHPLLDRAALASLGKVKSIPLAEAWLAGRHSDIVLPVEYRLTDS